MKELHLMYEKGKYNVNVQEYDGKIRIWKAVAKGLCEDEARRIVEKWKIYGRKSYFVSILACLGDFPLGAK